MSAGVQRLLRIDRNTRNLDRALAFYRNALGFAVDEISSLPPTWTRLAGVDATASRCARLSLGAQSIELIEFPNAAPYPQGSTSSDAWFQHCAIAVDDMQAAYARVLQHGATPITRDGPQTLPPSTGPVTAFKFRDPEGHPLELIAFPAGVGDPVWQSAHANGPALGIDHSAISVGDTQRSIEFYELLGLQVTARGVNRGIEQQRLDDLGNVEVDVVALQPTRSPTPHVELLGYRNPRDRTAPNMNPSDIAADKLVLCMQNLHAVLDMLSGAILKSTARGMLGPARGTHETLLRDPDGHWLLLM